MNINVVLYLLITSVVALNGCTSHPDASGTNDGNKGGLLMVHGEMICQEVSTNKMWQFKKKGPFSSREAAEHYASELKIGGYDDWRLPGISELFDIFYMHYFQNHGDCEMNHRGDFWSLTKDKEPSLGHWEDYLLCGPEFKFVDSMKDYGFVRAIRP